MYEVLDSTNQESKRLILQENINPDNFVITAKFQTSGRGRQGKNWISEDGNLFASFTFDIKNYQNPEIFSYFFAVALCRILKKENINPQIKWPNDVLINGAKLSGILLEKHKDFLICGIGINIISSPDYLLDKKTVSLKNLDFNISAEDLLKLLCVEISKIITEYKKSGFESLSQEINEALIKGFAEISIADTKKKGEILSINNFGKLLFKTDNGIEEISSGEVFYL